MKIEIQNNVNIIFEYFQMTLKISQSSISKTGVFSPATSNYIINCWTSRNQALYRLKIIFGFFKQETNISAMIAPALINGFLGYLFMF
jgi:hypothetical protein